MLAQYFESAEDQGSIKYQANITLPVHYLTFFLLDLSDFRSCSSSDPSGNLQLMEV